METRQAARITVPKASYITPTIESDYHPYNKKWGDATQTLAIDARAGHVYIHLSEYDRDSNRTKDIAISVTLDEWRQYVQALKEHGGGELQ